jgi:hypothetical protein
VTSFHGVEAGAWMDVATTEVPLTNLIIETPSRADLFRFRLKNNKDDGERLLQNKERGHENDGEIGLQNKDENIMRGHENDGEIGLQNKDENIMRGHENDGQV